MTSCFDEMAYVGDAPIVILSPVYELKQSDANSWQVCVVHSAGYASTQTVLESARVTSVDVAELQVRAEGDAAAPADKDAKHGSTWATVQLAVIV